MEWVLLSAMAPSKQEPVQQHGFWKARHQTLGFVANALLWGMQMITAHSGAS